jgi:transcriptional regulator of arginine metabolism
MSAKDRRKSLRKLLLMGRGGSQGELLELLRDQGHHTTQSTISRDLKLLGAERRLDAQGELVYTLESGNQAAFPSQMILSVEHNEQLLVVRTRVGRAPAVGIELDNLRDPDILGTLAGNDTVLVVPARIALLPRLAARLRELSEMPD